MLNETYENMFRSKVREKSLIFHFYF